jgi:hypothetical protein
VGGLRTLLDLGVGITTLVWFYQLFDHLQGRARYTPGMAVAWWFIPGANLVMPGLVLRNAWQVVVGQEGHGLPIVWWLLHLGTTMATMFWKLLPHLHPDAPVFGYLHEWGVLASWGSLLLHIGAYALLLRIVRTLSKRVA